MSIFLAPLAAGLTGLVLLALPHTKRHARHNHHSHHKFALEPRSVPSLTVGRRAVTVSGVQD
jgi:hypothetical protein